MQLSNEVYFSDLLTNNLLAFNPQTFEIRTIGEIDSNDQITDIAFSPSGALFGISRSNLYRINQNSGLTQLVTSFSRDDLNGLSFDDKGRLFASGSDTNSVFIVNTSSGVLTPIAQLSSNSSGDIVIYNNQINVATNNRVLERRNFQGNQVFPDLNHGIDNLFGVSISNGEVLYGLAGSNVFSIDPLTGSSRIEFTLPASISIGGAASPNESTFRTIFGRNSANRIVGTNRKDQLIGLRGNDTLLGGLNDDFLLGGQGADLLKGQSQNDLIFGQGNNDELNGGDGNDSLNGGGGNDILFGVKGEDFLDGNNNDDSLNGGSERDTLVGGRGNDNLIGGTGLDVLNGTVNGANGVLERDTLIGGRGEQDRFLFGNSKASVVYYLDSGMGGTSSARILDFESMDRLLLLGNRTDYRLVEKNGDTILLYVEPGADDTIAILDNTRGLNLSGPQFIYI